MQQQNLYLREELKSEYNFEEIIGSSAALGQVLATLRQVAPTDSTVLILGETGTGKELIARAIHNLSKRKDKPLIKLNCSALPTGREPLRRQDRTQDHARAARDHASLRRIRGRGIFASSKMSSSAR